MSQRVFSTSTRHDTTRAVTPPNPSQNNANLEPATTPERVRQVELNRLRGRHLFLIVSIVSSLPSSLFLAHCFFFLLLTRDGQKLSLCLLPAKARQREKEASASASSVASSARNANNKRPLAVVVPATSGSPTGPSKNNTGGGDKLQRDSRLGKYFDYDLSKMVNSKGGFLVEDDKEVDDHAKTKERERERQRAVQNLDPRTWFCLIFIHLTCVPGSPYVSYIAIYLDPSRNPKCHDCGSVDIDQMYRNIFKCIVCNKCRNEKVEKYGLLTKTECKEVNVIRLTHTCDLRIPPVRTTS